MEASNEMTAQRRHSVDLFRVDDAPTSDLSVGCVVLSAVAGLYGFEDVTSQTIPR